MIITDSTPLIHLGKAGKLSLLQSCFKKNFIPKEVYQEVLAFPVSSEAIFLKRAVEDGWISVEDVALHKPLEQYTWLDEGELKAISLALEKKKPLLMDNNLAKQVTILFGVEVHGTLYVLLEAYKRKLIGRKEIITTLNSMILNSFYLSTTVYALFLELLGKRE